MAELYALSRFMVQFFGPLTAACLVMMYVLVHRYTGRAPGLREVLYLYVRYNIKNRRHAGLLTYLLIVSALFFALSVIGLLVGAFNK